MIWWFIGVASGIIFVLCLYFVLIMPRMNNKVDLSVLKGKYFAHRGFHNEDDDCPENSMGAFRRAVERGYGIELDVRLTKDERVVVFHDDTLNRMCGVKGKVKDYTFEELQQFSLKGTEEKIPLFSEVLKLVDGKIPLLVEIKATGKSFYVTGQVDRLLREYKGPYCVESFHPGVLFWYRLHRKGVVRGQLSSAFRKDGDKEGVSLFLVRHLLLNCFGRPDFIAYKHTYPKAMSRKLCRNLFKASAAAWTIKSKEELEKAKKYFDVFIFEGFVPQK